MQNIRGSSPPRYCGKLEIKEEHRDSNCPLLWKNKSFKAKSIASGGHYISEKSKNGDV